ncbi:MAG: ATP-dependent DNA helicase RecG [Bacilli bacterium]
MSDLSRVKGIGEKNKETLNKLGISNIEELISYYPYKHNVIHISDIHEAPEDTSVIVQGKIDSYPIFRRFNRTLNSLSFRVNINNKVVGVVIYNRMFLKNNLIPGLTITIIGKYNSLKNTFFASDIKFEGIKEGSIESIYHLTKGLSDKVLKKYINSALSMGYTLKDYVPDYLNEEYKFISKMDAIKYIHNPQTTTEIKHAKLKLIYEELFTFMFKINYLKYINKLQIREEKRIVDISLVDEFIRTLPFELTVDQVKATKDIYEDLTSGKRMNRMLQGDTGSGKTIVGVIASYINYLAGFETALMAPTEILAVQHYENIKEILSGTNMVVSLLTGSTKPKEKAQIYEDLENGKIDLIIGTHSLLNENLNFKNLGLVITDEQHRFGVNQRSNLKNKSVLPDTLYMSATPIPRTFALTIYGDMDISNIKTKPKGRKEIKTIIKTEKEIKEVLFLMLEEIKQGHQIYVISPLIDESDTINLNTVKKLKEELDTAFNEKVTIGVLHGKLSSKDKTEVMEKFKNKETQILISTTVIEVGVDVKNATMMVIFDAVRFGLATIHQLRGRIGRSDILSTCILIGDKRNKRLQVLNSSNDGFYITEKDFEMRGEGDIFGVKQSGDMTFSIANIKRDFKILLQTKEDTNEFIKQNIKNKFELYPLYKKIIDSIDKLD